MTQLTKLTKLARGTSVHVSVMPVQCVDLRIHLQLNYSCRCLRGWMPQ